MKAALDTNVLVYAEGVNGLDRQRVALELLRRLPTTVALVPVQVLGELYTLGDRGTRPNCCLDDQFHYCRYDEFRARCGCGSSCCASAGHLGQPDYRSRSREWLPALLSEDLKDGFIWSGLTIANPFPVRRMPMPASLLESGTGEGIAQ